jgi:hypothetical protein
MRHFAWIGAPGSKLSWYEIWLLLSWALALLAFVWLILDVRKVARRLRVASTDASVESAHGSEAGQETWFSE